MRRADRLFRIIQVLRRKKRPITANDIAEELETSVRTIYRDIAQLMADRVPIRGEAGIGYVLDEGFDMPPLMLTPDEVEAAMLGAQWVAGRGDAVLSRAANDLLAKIGQVIPEHLRPLLMEPVMSAPPKWNAPADSIDMPLLRNAIRRQSKLGIFYRDEQGAETQRVIWPIAVAYFDKVRVIVAWCELRQGFRHFRTDRIGKYEFLEARYATPRAKLKAQWRKEMMERMERMRGGEGARV
ncbi:MAG: YafY family transcriptional regulator [Alphaproteobacteria bacterium]|nr:YafY family transcriptional regulator [Alphaproteobacteria bacterium]MDE2112148.1 YafY family transcriptional regulator [Alphaproteobacteria bacterium]MDE2495779.1 YafY family transcriptional regulator [Alphaproteobacteria bacterium]